MALELTTNPEEIAWAAGLFEGEGHVTANHKAPRGRPRVVACLGICDKDVLDRFVVAMGGGSVWMDKRTNPAHRDIWRWQVTGRAAKPVLEMLLPWMCSRRREAVERALRLVGEIGINNCDKTHCPAGHPYDEANTYVRPFDGSRRCKTCLNGQKRQRRWLQSIVEAWPS